jgi:hypothetical protein
VSGVAIVAISRRAARPNQARSRRQTAAVVTYETRLPSAKLASQGADSPRSSRRALVFPAGPASRSTPSARSAARGIEQERQVILSLVEGTSADWNSTGSKRLEGTRPARTPQSNAFCGRVTGTMRREGLDWLNPLNERHLRQMLWAWVARYNRGGRI